jgi:hypothetical protein
VEGSADHHPVSVAGERKSDCLVGVGGAAGGEAAEVGVPQAGRASLGLREHACG